MKLITGPYTTAPGARRVYRDWQMWAEDGLIFLENQKDGEIAMLSCAEASHKLSVFAGEAEEWDKKKENADPQARAFARDYHRYLRGLVESLSETIDDAKTQGDPNDETVRRHKFRLFIRSKREGMGGVSTTSILGAMFGQASPEPIVFQAGSKWLARGPKGVDQRR